MKQNYLFWKEEVEILKEVIEKYKQGIAKNEWYLEMAKAKLKSLPKPKGVDGAG